jgi:hypothetical protein
MRWTRTTRRWSKRFDHPHLIDPINLLYFLLIQFADIKEENKKLMAKANGSEARYIEANEAMIKWD